MSQSTTSASVNPETGLQEFSVECADEGGCRQYPPGIEVFPVTGTRSPPPPPPVIRPPAIPIQPIIGPPPLPPASQILDAPGTPTNNYLPEEITVVPNTDAGRSFFESLTSPPSVEEIQNWSNDKILRELNMVENVYMPGGLGNMRTTATRGMTATGLGVGAIYGRDAVYSDRLRQVCQQRGLAC